MILVVVVLTSTDHASIVMPGMNMCVVGSAVPCDKNGYKVVIALTLTPVHLLVTPTRRRQLPTLSHMVITALLLTEVGRWHKPRT